MKQDYCKYSQNYHVYYIYLIGVFIQLVPGFICLIKVISDGPNNNIKDLNKFKIKKLCDDNYLNTNIILKYFENLYIHIISVITSERDMEKDFNEQLDNINKVKKAKLKGLIISVKDLFDVKGYKTKGGTKFIDDEVVQNCDYIVLGYVRVPLLQLITKNNGVDGDFTIFDEFKQKMGSMRLRITLNHFNSQRPLYSTSTKIPSQVNNSISETNLKSTLID